jgi:hypothetical protein
VPLKCISDRRKVKELKAKALEDKIHELEAAISLLSKQQAQTIVDKKRNRLEESTMTLHTIGGFAFYLPSSGRFWKSAKSTADVEMIEDDIESWGESRD